jgi:hypothetical protein
VLGALLAFALPAVATASVGESSNEGADVGAPRAFAADARAEFAATIAKRAVRKEIGSTRLLSAGCRVPRLHHATCSASWKSSGRYYLATIKIVAITTPTEVRHRYTMTGKSGSVDGWSSRFRRTGVIDVPIPAGTARTNPLPMGSAGTINEWDIRVLLVRLMPVDEAGTQNVVATIAATYKGEGASQMSSVDFHAVGDSAVAVGDGCSLSNGEIQRYADVFTGGTLQGDICFPAKAADVSSLVMYVDETFVGPTVYFALRP